MYNPVSTHGVHVDGEAHSFHWTLGSSSFTTIEFKSASNDGTSSQLIWSIPKLEISLSRVLGGEMVGTTFDAGGIVTRRGVMGGALLLNVVFVDCTGFALLLFGVVDRSLRLIKRI